MTDITVTIDVADFRPDQPTGPVQVLISRATVDTSGTVIVSMSPQEVLLPAGTATVTLEAGVAYQWTLLGVRGFESTWYASHTADCTAAELYRDHQIDPATLETVVVPQSVADQIAALAAQVAALSTGGGGVSIVDNGDGTLSSSSSSIVDNGDGTLSAA